MSGSTTSSRPGGGAPEVTVGATDLAAAMLVTEIRRRTPRERALWFAGKRANLAAAGRSVEVLDLAQRVLDAHDQEQVAELLALAKPVVDRFAADHHGELSRLPSAWATALVVQMTVACLYGYGLAEPRPARAGQWVGDWRAAVPEPLWPDVAAAVAAFDGVATAAGRASDHDQGGGQ